jgi:hypothetical protein
MGRGRPETANRTLFTSAMPLSIRRTPMIAALAPVRPGHPAAFHGVAHAVQQDAKLGARVSVLRSLYRFGAMLEPGFHHDAQPRDRSEFHQFEFDCSAEGRIVISGPHANIYPNDFVRAARKDKI